MVKHLHVTLDEDEHDRITETKNQTGMTWREYILEATEMIEDEYE